MRILVTGGASGLGAGTARALTAQGARVVLADVQDEAGQALAAELGQTYIHCDVTAETDAQAAVDAATALGTLRGLVKKTRLSDYDSTRSGGVIAINLREDEDGLPDEVVSACIVNSTDDLILVSRKGQSIRFTANDDALRPMGRATSGVTGMKFRTEDQLLAMDVVRDGSFLFTVTEGGIAKRTALTVENYRVQGRGGLGIKVANLPEANGDLVGALVTDEDDEVLVIMERGKIVRSAVSEVNATGRATQGVIFAKPENNDRIIAVARNIERHLGDDAGTVVDETASSDVSADAPAASLQPVPEDPTGAESSPQEDA